MRYQHTYFKSYEQIYHYYWCYLSINQEVNPSKINLTREHFFQNNDSTDEEEDLDMPSSAECLNRCREFASITSTDNALAMFYLQDTKWDLQVKFLKKN